MPFTTTKPVGLFTDINGKPLDGQVFFGQPNLDPIANPITVYWDAAGTQPVTQPVVTVGGYPMNGSTRSNVFVNADYSILVRNRNGFTVFSAPNLPFEDSSDNQYFLQAGFGAVQRTVQSKLRDVVSVKDFGAVGDWDGTTGTDDTAAINATIASLGSNGGTVFFPTGRYKTTSKITVSAPIRIVGTGRGSNGGVHKCEIVKTGSYTALEFVPGAAWGGIQDIAIGSSNPAFTGDGLYISSGRIDLDRIAITNQAGFGINVYDANCSNFSNVYIFNCAIGLYIDGATPPDTNGATFVNFDILSSRQDGIYVAKSIANTFVGMCVQGSTRYGIFINSDRHIFYGTYSENNGGPNDALVFGASADFNFVEFTTADTLGTVTNPTRSNGWRVLGGNYVLANGEGIDFSQTLPAAGMTSQIFNRYEEGTWTPAQGAGLTVVGAFSSSGTYTRIGRQVTVSGRVQGATSVALSAGGLLTNNLPFATGSSGVGAAVDSTATKTSALIAYAGGSFQVYSAQATTASPFVDFSLTYFVQ